MQVEKKVQNNIDIRPLDKMDGKSLVLSDNYVIIKRIGSGSFGEVYLAQHKNGGYVAVKVEDRLKPARVINEYKIYRHLSRSGFRIGLPKTYDLLQTPDYNILVMQLLGPSLDELFIKYSRKFKLPTVFQLAFQFLQLIEHLHRANFIHRDIKPNNFLIGRDSRDQIFMIDPGLSKKYIEDGKHMKFKNNRSLIGTARYASVNMHMGIEPSRRDDLEAIGYMLIYFAKGSLPWQGLKKKKGVHNIEIIGETKMCTNLEVLCKDLPKCFANYISYCRKLKFEEDPDYKYMTGLFQTSVQELGITPHFEWI